jgi:predicted nucleotidyltransferase
MQSLSHLLQRLADSGVEFVIIGGFAGVLHGSALVTRDLDICAVLTPANIERLRVALKDLNPKHRMTPQALSFLQVPKPGEGANNLYLRTDWGVVDVLSSVLGLGDFERLKVHAETIIIGGKPCQLIGLEDLILAKEAMGRDKDLLAAKELRAVAEKRRQRRG